MLEIHQRTDLSGYEELAAGIENPIVIEAVNDGKVSGFCVFEYCKDTVKIFAVEAGNDLYLYDGLARTALFKASVIGIDKAVFFKETIATAKKLHLSDDNGVTVSIASVMGGCEGCKDK